MAYPGGESFRKNGFAPQYFPEAARQGQNAQFNGVVLPFSQNGSRNDSTYKAKGHIDLTSTPTQGLRLQSQAVQNVPSPQSGKPCNTSSPTVLSDSNGRASGTTAAAQSPTPPLDYQLLLISLAEEYFAAAYSGGSLAALVRRETEMQSYYKLIATGLGCLEAVLKHWRLQPHVEAVVRLRYATILHDETENVMEAEEALSKGITICDRHRFFDLKYNMQHLLARVLFKENPRASLKFLDGIVKDVEAYQHIAWAYAFRFLRVFLSLELPSHQDTLSALSHLRSLCAMSSSYGDKAILAIAATLEALTHLRESSSAESIEQAQRALAAARSSQLDPVVGGIPQLAVLTHFVDLCCTLKKFDPAQAVSKMQAMQKMLETVDTGHSWTDDGSFAIPTMYSGTSKVRTNSGIVRSQTDGTLVLMFSWMPREDIYVLGFLLSSLALAHRNTTDGQKTEQMLKEGIRMQERNFPKTLTLSESVSSASFRQQWRQLLKCFMQINLTFALCARTAWSPAQDQLTSLKSTASNFPAQTPPSITLLIHYLTGIIAQGTGLLPTALSIFLSPSLSLSTPSTSQIQTTLSILSTLNAILIIRSPTHPSHHLLPTLLPLLQTHCALSPQKSLQAAYNLILATTPPSSSSPNHHQHQQPTILHTKQHLQLALQSAKNAQNNQLMTMTLNFMSWKFFRGVVGDQAEKSARASQTLAIKGMDALWGSVAAGVLADTLEVQRRGPEAEGVRAEGRRVAGGLPIAVWDANWGSAGEGGEEGGKGEGA